MRSASTIIALLLTVTPSYADAVLYTSEAAFLQVLERPYLLEDFGFYSYGSYKNESLRLDQNGYIAVLSARRGLYSLDASMSTRWDVDILRIDFTESPSPVTAVGGYFWPTDLPGNNLIGPVRIALSDGSQYLMNDARYGDFLGFTMLEGTTFQFLEISTLAGRTWPSVDHLYVGKDPPLLTPEVSTFLLLSAGVCVICIAFLRKKLWPNRRVD